ncbi:LacI family DNA-binding transcriptional regulator [Enterovibrio sp. ZSDZ35]|uniref:Autoinducer 2-binding periplasmic protein LuxP n=1 Tax=Enterovibrio qingdaonensis TaxID=2899818 RepID=A0ABT5QIG8_9GAMM|nr:LacI family DNA-binding transcriptional regulator [Enterovibrio sp. ZSDZ35]MDD1780777.1 LacI family DNA-binding transcriptional regulator [Enterovibrio sp. ZSDZ35]
MAKRITIKQIAEKAKVSVATVDRVINQRAPVKSATTKRIMESAKELGWRPPAVFEAAMQESNVIRPINGVVLLQKNISPLCAAAFENSAQSILDPASSISVDVIDDLDPEVIATRMIKLGKKHDVIVVTAVDHPFISAAIDKLKSNNVPVIALLSDLTSPNVAGYVGTNNRMRGRTAAWAMHRFCRDRGSIGVLIGSHRYLSQEDREISFRSYFREKAPAFRLLESIPTLDDEQMTYEATKKLLREYPDLVGIFSAGGGSSGTRKAIQEFGRDQPPFYVSLELAPQSRIDLLQGGIDVILSGDFGQIAEEAIQMMIDVKQERFTEKKNKVLPFYIYTSENI